MVHSLVRIIPIFCYAMICDAIGSAQQSWSENTYRKFLQLLQAGAENVDRIFETVSQTLENVTVLVLSLDFISAFSVETLSFKANFEKIRIRSNSNQIDNFGASGQTTNVYELGKG